MTTGRPRTPIGTFGRIAVREAGGRYTAITRFRDVDGRLRKVEATAPSRRGAEALLKQRLTDRAGYGSGGVLSVSSDFGELCELWLEDLDLREISEGTKQNYRDDLRRYVRPAFDHLTLGEMTTGRVERFLRGEAAASHSRAKHSRTLLNQLFDFALRHDAIARNPVEGTSRLARPKHEIRALTLEQVQAIRAAAAAWRTDPGANGPRPDGKVRDICEVLLGTSMRPGEVLALRPCDVAETTAGMVLHVQGTVVRRHGTADFRQDQPKTDASNRRIAVPDFAAEVIRRRLPEQADTTIFHNRDGGPISLHNLRRTFRAFLVDAGLGDSGITPRWYRRTGATVLARGLGADAAATFLGHTSTAEADTNMRAALVTDTLEMAVWSRGRAGVTDLTGLIHHSDAGSQGGLKRSSQHLVITEVSGGATAAAGGPGVATGDAFTGAADSRSACGAGVLAADRGGQEFRGGRGRGRCVVAGRVAVVSSRWRDGAVAAGRADRPLPVVPRARGARTSQSARAWCSRDRPRAGA